MIELASIILCCGCYYLLSGKGFYGGNRPAYRLNALKLKVSLKQFYTSLNEPHMIGQQQMSTARIITVISMPIT